MIDRDRFRILSKAQTPVVGECGDDDRTSSGEITKYPLSRSMVRYTKTCHFKPNKNVLRENKVIIKSEDEEIANAYKLLRTQVLQRAKLNKWNVIGITSPNDNEGKTLTALNLSIALAREVNHTVLLVDLNLRKPSINKYLGYEPAYGLQDYLLNDIPLERILFNPNIERLVILPSRGEIVHSSEMLSSPKMVFLVEELRQRYPDRYVIFDLPSLLLTDDALAFSPYIDALLLVIKEGSTKSADLKRSLELLSGVNLLGTILNQCGA